MVWKSPRQEHERKNTIAVLIALVILLGWLIDGVRGWF